MASTSTSTTGTTLGDLAAQISSCTNTISKYLGEHGLPEPTFAVGTKPLPEVAVVQQARLELIEAAMKLHHLAVGPEEYIQTQSFVAKHDLLVWYLLSSFDVFDAVPIDGDASYAEIAAKVGLSESLVRRIFRHSITQEVFAESAPGSDRVRHTASSVVAANAPRLNSWVQHNLDEMQGGVFKQFEALRQWGETSDPGKTGVMMALCPGEEDPPALFTFMEQDGEGERKGWRARRFAQAMELWSAVGPTRVDHLHAAFDWDALGDATLVDVGGSVGHVSIGLARHNPKLKCIVQDLPERAEGFAALVPADLKSRVTFQPHDFFTPQPVHGADVYFFRYILHDWADTHALRILRALLPALKPGARIIVVETVIQPHGKTPLYMERIVTALDLQMLVAVNAKERTYDDWRRLFAEADPRFELRKVHQPLGCATGLIEVVFNEK